MPWSMILILTKGDMLCRLGRKAFKVAMKKVQHMTSQLNRFTIIMLQYL